jgi:thymidylate kinase
MPIKFLSLNGPDNAGKTTQFRLLSEARPRLQTLGSAQEHAPDP